MTLKIKLSVVSEIPIHALTRMLCESCGHYALPLFTDFQLKRTHQSLYLKCRLAKNIATERVISEFLKLICGKDAVKILDAYRETIAVIIPEITVMFNFNQNNIHHSYDLWQHTLTALGTIEPNPILRMTMLLHDIGKPSVKPPTTAVNRIFRDISLKVKNCRQNSAQTKITV